MVKAPGAGRVRQGVVRAPAGKEGLPEPFRHLSAGPAFCREPSIFPLECSLQELVHAAGGPCPFLANRAHEWSSLNRTRAFHAACNSIPG